MQEEKEPKIFISYSWSSDDFVLHLAERLVSHGVDVVLDKWDLKEGQDKYAFMEQCVTNPEITKVLIICDEKYAQKANGRTGGVGDETVIISSEVYGKMNQEKFIPVIAQKDESGNPFVPAYIRSRIYIDLSDEDRYEDEYDKLLRNIYNKPLYRKPVLGKRPTWLDEETGDLYPLQDIIRQIKGSTAEKKQKFLVDRFLNEYLEALKKYFPDNIPDAKQVYDSFVSMKEIRDVFLDFLPALDTTDLPLGEAIGDFFETMYNTLTGQECFSQEISRIQEVSYDIYHLHIWELFICITVYLRHKKDYASIHEIVTRTYFLRRNHYDKTQIATNYCAFRFYSRAVEEYYKPHTDYAKHYTLIGDELCKRREKLPLYSEQLIAEADLFLYQIRNAYELSCSKYEFGDNYWFPTCYVYTENTLYEWTRMKSKMFCERYMFALFGVKTIEQLQDKIKRCKVSNDMRYSGNHFNHASAILETITLEEIGSLN